MPHFLKNQLPFTRLGYLTFSVMVFFLFIIIVEFFFGNGDGVWCDYNLYLIGFTILAWVVGALFFYLILKNSPPILQNISLSLFSVLAMAYSLDTVVGWIDSFNEKPVAAVALTNPDNAKPWHYLGPMYDSSYTFDPFLGRKPIPNHTFVWTKKFNGKPFVQIPMHVDSFSRRITPFADSTPLIRNQYALFLGCSFTYGDAVRDNETMPYYFQKNNIDYQSYNYGFFGYSPRHALARFQHQNLVKEVPQKDGFAVYVYIEDHINRSIPTAAWIGLYDGYFPDLDEPNMQTTGLYRFLHPIKYRLGMILFKSKIRRHFALDFPFSHRDKDYQLTANLIKATEVQYTKQFKNNKFYVLFYPDLTGKSNSPMLKLLQERGLKVLDYRKLLKSYPNIPLLKYDVHPSPEAHRVVMAHFSKDLKGL